MSEEHSAPPEEHAAHEAGSQIWLGGSDVDTVELSTVGIDVGSSTSHAVFARVLLRRQAHCLSSRYAVIDRQVVARGPIALTPYLVDGRIDADAVQKIMDEAYQQANIRPDEVDTGAVILTGAALDRPNAAALSQRLAGSGGTFVCASAGHRLEAIMSAHGSGAVDFSRTVDTTVLHIDIGGGTSKFSLIRQGEIVATAAMRVGGRLLAVDEASLVSRIEPAAARVAEELGIAVRLGEPLSDDSRQAIADQLARLLTEVACGAPLSPLAAELLLTAPLPAPLPAPMPAPMSASTPAPDDASHEPTVVTFSGGVAEYVYGRQPDRYGDLGPALATAVVEVLGGRLPLRREPIGELIRATVIGAAEFTVQLSGATVYLSNEAVLPLRNVPVARPRIDRAAPGRLRALIHEALDRMDIQLPEQPVAVALPRLPEPSYQALRQLADALASAVPGALTGRAPLVLAIGGDLGMSLGRILVDELGCRSPVIALDELELRELDYVDVGAVVRPAGVVPVVVKSLLFAPTISG